MKALERKTDKTRRPEAPQGYQARLPAGLQIGQRFLLHLDDSGTGAWQGRLQELSRDGSLCVDAPVDLRPPRGTPVRVRSLPAGTEAYSFATEIRGRGRLKRSQVPVLLLAPPESVERAAPRTSHRVTVCLRGQVEWRVPAMVRPAWSAHPVVLTNLSGGGAQVYLRQRPEADRVRLALHLPDSFVQETANRQWRRDGLSLRDLAAPADVVQATADRIRSRFCGIEASIVSSRLHLQDERGAVYAVSLAFAQPQEGCYQLVRYLERQYLKKGLRPLEEPRRRGAPGPGEDRTRREPVLVATAA